MQGDDFPVDHYIDGAVEVKVNAVDFADFRERMLNVGTVIKTWQVAN
jgi:hypothetical protein